MTSLLLLAALSAAAPSDATPAPRAQMSLRAVQTEDGARLGVHYTIAPGWHIYWENPGDSGMPTSADVQPPPRWTAGPLRFPGPHAFEDEGLVSYGYEGEVTLLVDLRGEGGGEVAVRSRWLVCREVCEPESAEARMSLAALPSADPQIAASAARLPRAPTAKDGVIVERLDGQLVIEAPRPASLFPGLALEAALGGARPRFVREESVKSGPRWLLRAPLDPTATAELDGVLVLGDQDAILQLTLPAH